MSLNCRLLASSMAFLLTVTPLLCAAESLWIEAEHLDGIKGYCWPMGQPNMKKTSGNWGLSGPGWAAEWTQGGESGFLSIATAADDDKAVATASIEVPVDGDYFLWVRYGDWREQAERFEIRLEQGDTGSTSEFGRKAVIDEDNEMKLYWGWAFGWDSRPVKLKKGKAQLRLMTSTKDAQPRQIDVIVLTTDATYRPLIKDRPANHAWKVLDSYRSGALKNLEPLARKARELQAPVPASNESSAPALWKTRTFNDKGFLYLWNVSHTNATDTWLGDKPNRVVVPYNIADKEAREEFEKLYGGKPASDIPIFGDDRVAPTFHGVGAGVFATDAKTGEVNDAGKRFGTWLDANPKRHWGMMMNYHPGAPIGEKGVAMFEKYRGRYVGSIAGESLGYFYPDAKMMAEATANAATRRQLVEAFTPLSLESNAQKYRSVYSKDLDKNPYTDVIPCPSVGNMLWAPICFDWGARTVGYESHVATSAVLGMRMAFMRGAARQHGGLLATYRSCNFGDSATIFSNAGSYHSPQAVLDNYYSVYSGAGMTWYKFDLWYQYMAGVSMFYHEQGFDEFWQPGGTGAAGKQQVQLSPKGKLVDRFLRVTAKEKDRGTPYTPVAFLVDYAHGWEPSPYWPNSFKNWHSNPDKFRFGDHEKMLEQYFFAAYHPVGPHSEKPITATSEVTIPTPFGDIFDVIFAYPDHNKWKTIDTYPVVIAAGDIELSDAEGHRLHKYVMEGGTLVIADAHLTGPGASKLQLPTLGEPAEAEGYKWMKDEAVQPSQRYRYREIKDFPHTRLRQEDVVHPLATTRDGKVFCAAFDVGRGRIILVSTPRGLGIDRSLHPVVARVMGHVTRGLMPVEVDGDVNWMVNQASEGKWLVTLLNPYGQDKPQQGITATDYRQNRKVTIKSRVPVTAARDWLMPDDTLSVKENQVTIEVLAGGVRIIELK